MESGDEGDCLGDLENNVWVKIAVHMCHHASDTKEEKKKKRKDKASCASPLSLDRTQHLAKL